ncbi:MAG: type VI secretion system contractile sheath domain-containing protein [Gammaproteobacteria bacterium]
MASTIRFDVSFNKPGREDHRTTPQQFRILVLGDFSGRRSSRVKYRPVPVDCDNLEERLGHFNASLDLNADDLDPGLHIEISSLDDFHPDRLYDHVAVFDELRTLRTRLLNPDTFTEAAKSLRDGEIPSAPSPREAPPPDTGKPFADLLGKPMIEDRTAIQPHPAVSRLLRKFVDPHVVEDPGPEQDRLVATVDRAISLLMQEILHHEGFQALESSWRGVDFLLRELELGTEVGVYLLDLSKSQLIAELAAFENSPLYHALVTDAGGTPGSEMWNLIIGLYDFTVNETGLLGSVAELARAANTSFITQIAYRSLEKDFDSAWETLRRSASSAYLCLCTPGLLLRLPYGANTDEIESFEFEEMPEEPVHAYYLWGNAALVAATLIAKSLGRDDMRPGGITQLDGLPVATYRIQGEPEMVPCGGAWISDSEAQRLIQQGIIPVLSVRNRDAVRIMGFQSLAGGPVLV